MSPLQMTTNILSSNSQPGAYILFGRTKHLALPLLIKIGSLDCSDYYRFSLSLGKHLASNGLILINDYKAQATFPRCLCLDVEITQHKLVTFYSALLKVAHFPSRNF